MLNRFEHNVTVQSILDQISSLTKTTTLASFKKDNFNKDNEITDLIPISKKSCTVIDDPLIIDDVRLCINDIILFLTSNFCQTTLLSSASSLAATTTTATTATTSQCSTPLSISFHDLSLIPSFASIKTTATSLPSTPSASRSFLHHSLTRFSSTTNQDHSFNTENVRRLPTTTLSRYIDTSNLTSLSSIKSSIFGRKNKNKQPSNDLLLNVNNNNNNNINKEEGSLQQQEQRHTINVSLPEDCSEFFVVDEQNDNDWLGNTKRSLGIRMCSQR